MPAARLKPLDLKTLPRVIDLIRDIGKAAGVVVNDSGKFASAHDLRRAFGTRWAQKVMPPTLMILMRHEDINTTLRYYVGLTTADAGREIYGDGVQPPVPTNVPKAKSKGRRAG